MKDTTTFGKELLEKWEAFAGGGMLAKVEYNMLVKETLLWLVRREMKRSETVVRYWPG